MMMSHPGDYQVVNLNVPGQVQQTNYYCGPASAYAVLKDYGYSVTQASMASLLATDEDGTILANFPGAMNSFTSDDGFNYSVLYGPGYYTSDWAMALTNNSIITVLDGRGVVYDVHMVNVPGSARLCGYSTISRDIYHYVAGEGFDSSNPASRKCKYYDSNNKKNWSNRHFEVTYQTMARLTDDFGVVW